ncbi:hypothetical protein CsSME_00003044 [Camellia sinensis var. sinensis]
MLMERDDSMYHVRVVEIVDVPKKSMGGGDLSSTTNHASRQKDDDVANLVADVAISRDMEDSKRSNDVAVGVGSEHMSNSASLSMVNEIGVEMRICNTAVVNPLPNVSMQTSLLQELKGGGSRAVEAVEASTELNGLMQSLSESDLLKPNISLEVILDEAHFDGHSKGHDNDKAVSAEKENPIEEVGDSDDELSPSKDEGEVSQPGAYVWANRIAAQVKESNRTRTKKELSEKETINTVGVQGRFWRRKRK